MDVNAAIYESDLVDDHRNPASRLIVARWVAGQQAESDWGASESAQACADRYRRLAENAGDIGYCGGSVVGESEVHQGSLTAVRDRAEGANFKAFDLADATACTWQTSAAMEGQARAQEIRIGDAVEIEEDQRSPRCLDGLRRSNFDLVEPNLQNADHVCGERGGGEGGRNKDEREYTVTLPPDEITLSDPDTADVRKRRKSFDEFDCQGRRGPESHHRSTSAQRKLRQMSAGRQRSEKTRESKWSVGCWPGLLVFVLRPDQSLQRHRARSDISASFDGSGSVIIIFG
ncbi:hypothetical protein C8R44DRAFT_738818 [Mycena epipterygia]|nr:hypothetical protein C8R44DRAFT_738818 [Mycena epipterygia]